MNSFDKELDVRALKAVPIRIVNKGGIYSNYKLAAKALGLSTWQYEVGSSGLSEDYKYKYVNHIVHPDYENIILVGIECPLGKQYIYSSNALEPWE